MVWRSKQFLLQPWSESFSCIYAQSTELVTEAELQARAEAREAAIERNAAKLPEPLGRAVAGAAFNVFPVNGDSMEFIPQNAYIQVNVYCDGRLIATYDDLNRMARLPPGWRGQVLEVEVIGTTPISEPRMAASMEELAGGGLG